MRTTRPAGGRDGATGGIAFEARLLEAREERELLRDLAECRRILAEALAEIGGDDAPVGADDPQSLARHFASTCAGRGAAGARLGAVFRRYTELRGQLALANLRLVAHVARGFRDRGIAYPDLLQEGFCGLLEAIDRFDLSRETKLATYATWWIRQAMQRAVAAGAYPVRLNPRHLRQLARNQDQLDRPGTDPPRIAEGSDAASADLIWRVHTATRPSVSLDSTFETDSGFSLLQVMHDPEGDRTDEVDRDEAVGKLLAELRPREREVLALRYGLGGGARLSLSQVGQVLEVSKERVRQIQDRALARLRALAEEHQLTDALIAGL